MWTWGTRRAGVYPRHLSVPINQIAAILVIHTTVVFLISMCHCQRLYLYTRCRYDGRSST